MNNSYFPPKKRKCHDFSTQLLCRRSLSFELVVACTLGSEMLAHLQRSIYLVVSTSDLLTSFAFDAFIKSQAQISRGCLELHKDIRTIADVTAR